MAIYSQVYSKVKSLQLNKFLSHLPHFSLEIVLLSIMILVVASNFIIRTNSTKAQNVNQSLFFVHLKNHPELNEKLADTYGSVNLTLNSNRGIFTRQVLAASTKSRGDGAQSQSTPLPTLSGSVLLKPNPASSEALLSNRDTEIYKVRGGDTVGRIAAAFGVSVDTILWENNLTSDGLIQPGQELRVLPASGITHTVEKGENLISIAKKYGLEDIETILEVNNIELENYIFEGDQLFIPNGVKKAPPSRSRLQYLAGLRREDYEQIQVPTSYQGSSSNLIWPQPGGNKISQYYWLRHPAIDIPCNYCSIIASADGIVELSGWQRGYGYTIVLNHGNGIKTRYGHGSKLLVSAGQKVSQGQNIMVSGSTGRSSGPHLHFEVIRNGQFLNPLSIVTR